MVVNIHVFGGVHPKGTYVPLEGSITDDGFSNQHDELCLAKMKDQISDITYSFQRNSSCLVSLK